MDQITEKSGLRLTIVYDAPDSDPSSALTLDTASHQIVVFGTPPTVAVEIFSRFGGQFSVSPLRATTAPDAPTIAALYGVHPPTAGEPTPVLMRRASSTGPSHVARIHQRAAGGVDLAVEADGERYFCSWLPDRNLVHLHVCEGVSAPRALRRLMQDLLRQLHFSADFLSFEAAAVMSAAGGALILGEPGAGKTTLLTHLLAELADLRFVANDETFLRATPGGGLDCRPSGIHVALKPQTLRAFPQLSPCSQFTQIPYTKAVVTAAEYAFLLGSQVSSGGSIKCVLLPRDADCGMVRDEEDPSAIVRATFNRFYLDSPWRAVLRRSATSAPWQNLSDSAIAAAERRTFDAIARLPRYVVGRRGLDEASANLNKLLKD